MDVELEALRDNDQTSEVFRKARREEQQVLGVRRRAIFADARQSMNISGNYLCNLLRLRRSN